MTIPHYKSRLSCVTNCLSGPQSLKYFLSGPLQKKFADSRLKKQMGEGSQIFLTEEIPYNKCEKNKGNRKIAIRTSQK